MRKLSAPRPETLRPPHDNTPGHANLRHPPGNPPRPARQHSAHANPPPPTRQLSGTSTTTLRNAPTLRQEHGDPPRPRHRAPRPAARQSRDSLDDPPKPP